MQQLRWDGVHRVGTVAAALLLLALALEAAPAQALEAPAPPALRLGLALLPGEEGASGLDAAAAPARRPFLALDLAAGVGTAVVAAPVSLLLGRWMGSLSKNLVVAAMPSLLLVAILPPLAVSLVESLVGERLWSEAVPLQPAVWIATGAQVVLLVGAIGLGVSAGDLLGASLFTLAEVLVLPATVTLTARLSAPRASRADLLPERSALASAARPDPPILPLVSFSF